MKLTLKLVCIVLAVTVLVLSIAGYLRVQREVNTFQSTMAQDGRLLGQDANASTHRFHFSWIPLESLTTALDRAVVDQQQRAALLRGDRVVVKTKDGEVMAKELKRRTTKTIELKSLNPSHAERTLPLQVAFEAGAIRVYRIEP